MPQKKAAVPKSPECPLNKSINYATYFLTFYPTIGTIILVQPVLQRDAAKDLKIFHGLKAGRPREWHARVRPEQVIQKLKDDAKKLRWIFLCVVCADGRTISSDTDTRTAIARLKEVKFGAIGYAGVVLIGSSIQIYTRPLLSGEDAQNDLHVVAGEKILEKFAVRLQGMAAEFLKEAEQELKGRMEGAK